MPGLLWRVLAGDDPGPVFVPWLWELAADRAGVTVDEMAASATTLVAALTSAAQLVEAEAVTVLMDGAAVLMDGADGPAAEALRRLVAAGGSLDVVAVVPGPVALAARSGVTDPDDRDENAEDLVRAVLEGRPHVLALDEPDPDPATAGCLRTITRQAAYYGARTLVIGPAIEGFDAAVAPGGSPSGIVTSGWAPRPRGTDADTLRAQARRVRQTREGARACP